MEYFTYSEKAFVYKYVVMLSDTDQFKHMSFANYLKLVYLATDALFLSCFDSNFLSKKRLKLAETQMQFKKQTPVGSRILIKVNASEVEGSRFSLLYTFVLEETGELVGLARQKYVLISQITQVPETISDGMKMLLDTIRVEEAGRLGRRRNEKEGPAATHQIFTFDHIIVFFKHTDYHGYVHPYNYLEWMSYTREAYFQNLVPNFLELCKRNINMVTADVWFELIGDAVFGDQISIKIYSENVRRLSFDVIFEFYCERRRSLLGKGCQRLTFLDIGSSKPALIPLELKNVVLLFERKP